MSERKLIAFDFAGTLANKNLINEQWDPIFLNTRDAFQSAIEDNPDLRFGIVTNGSRRYPFDFVHGLGMSACFKNDDGTLLIPRTGGTGRFIEQYEVPVKRTFREVLYQSEPRVDIKQRTIEKGLRFKPNPIIMTFLMQQAGVEGVENVIFVGDEAVDATFAKNAGVEFLSVPNERRGTHMKDIIDNALWRI